MSLFTLCLVVFVCRPPLTPSYSVAVFLSSHCTMSHRSTTSPPTEPDQLVSEGSSLLPVSKSVSVNGQGNIMGSPNRKAPPSGHLRGLCDMSLGESALNMSYVNDFSMSDRLAVDKILACRNETVETWHGIMSKINTVSSLYFQPPPNIRAMQLFVRCLQPLYKLLTPFRLVIYCRR